MSLIRIARYLPAEFSLNGVRKYFETKTGFSFTEWGLVVPKFNNVIAILETPHGKLLMPAANIVTTAGDTWYAQRASSETPTNTFTSHVLASAGTPGKGATYSSFTPIGSTLKVNTATYPKTADADADNTGSGATVVTHLATYTKADFTAASITHGLITIGSPVGGSALLTGYAFGATFSKTADDTLKVFVNHTFLGV